MDVTRLLPTFMRPHIRPTLLIFCLVLTAGLAIGFALPTRYVASAELWLDRGARMQRPGEQTSGTVLLARNTELQLLTSRELATRVVGALGLDRMAELEQLRRGLAFDPGAARGEAVNTVQRGLSVDPKGASNAVRLHFRGADPMLAVSVINRLAELYVEDRREAGFDARGRQRLERRVAQASASAIRAEANIDAYRQATMIIGRDGSPAGLGSDIGVLETKLEAAEGAARTMQSRAAREQALLEPALRSAERLRLQRAVEDDVAEPGLDRDVVRQRRRLDRVMVAARAADARVRYLMRIRDQALRRAAEQRAVTAELGRLKSVAAAAQAYQVRAVADLRRERAIEAARRSTAYIISRASPQSVRRDPAPWLVILAALTAAALAAVALAIGLESRHKGFATAAALERALGIPVLAMVPELTDVRSRMTGQERSWVPDYMVHHQDTSFADVFRSLWLHLRSIGPRSGSLVVSLSSALPDEGKTTVALCLARSAALSGQRTVLIDCDLRRPAASRALVPDLAAGLVEVLDGAADLSQVLERDPATDLMILGVSSSSHGQTKPLNIAAMRSTITRLREDFELIVCDTPPALALSEAREVAALADLVLVAVRQRETPKGAVTIAQDLLRHANAPLAGTVMTMVRV